MNNIRQMYLKAGCVSGRYCGDYQYREVFTTTNVVGQLIGGLCATMTNSGGGNVKVRAQNTWGLETGTRFPGTRNRGHASVQEMLSGKGAIQYPKSIFEDRSTPGMMQNVTLYFMWTEQLSCACQ